jgi:hypothetical protein
MKSRRRWYRVAAAAATVVALAALVLGAYGQLDTTAGAPATTDTLAARNAATDNQNHHPERTLGSPVSSPSARTRQPTRLVSPEISGRP